MRTKTEYLKSLICLLLITCFFSSQAQWQLINKNGGQPDPSAALEVSDTSRGFLPPRLTTSQMNAISSPASGLLIFNTTDSTYKYFDGTIWKGIGAVDSNSADTAIIISDGDQGTQVTVDDDQNIRFISGGSESARITPTGFLGIGINNPTSHLHIVRDTGYVILDPLDGRMELGSENDALSYIDFKGSGKLNEDFSGRIMHTVGAGFQWHTNGQLTPKMVLNDSGNLGIGTTAPHSDYPLTLNPIHPLGGHVVFNDTSDNSSWHIRAQGTNMQDLGFTESDVLDNRLVLQAGGNVGIGTDNPASAKLIVSDNQHSKIGVHTYATTAFSPSTLSLVKYRGSASAPTAVISGDRVGTIATFGYDGAQTRHVARIGFEIDGTPGAGDMPGRILFSTTADGDSTVTEHMRITNDGKIGMGTTVPTAKLHVTGKAPATATAGQIQIDDLVGSSMMLGRASSYGFIQTQNSHPLILNPLGNKIGIGTTTPTTDLHFAVDSFLVKNPVSFATTRLFIEGNRHNAGGSIGELLFQNKDASNGNSLYASAKISSENNGSSDDGDLRFFTTSNSVNSQAMMIDELGQVGIATTAPVTLFHVESTSDASLTNDGIVVFGVKTGTNMVIDGNEIMSRNNGAKSPLYLQNDGGDLIVGANKLFVTDAGNVGIGTSSPAEELDVEGDIQIDGDYKYESAKTNYASYHSSEFIISATNTNVHAYRQNLTSGSTGIIRVGTQGGSIANAAYLNAPVHLPHNATVTSVSCRFYDVNGTYNGRVRMVHQSHSSGVMTEMANVTSTGSSGNQTLVDNTISSPVINNATGVYSLLFETREATAQIMLYSVVITYTTTKAQ